MGGERGDGVFFARIIAALGVVFFFAVRVMVGRAYMNGKSPRACGRGVRRDVYARVPSELTVRSLSE